MARSIDESIKDTRTAALFVLGVCVAWITASSGYEATLRERGALANLMAFMMLRDAAKSAIFPDLSADSPDSPRDPPQTESDNFSVNCYISDPNKRTALSSRETKAYHGHPDPSLPVSHASITLTEETDWVLAAPWDESIHTPLVVGDTISYVSVAGESHVVHHLCISFPDEFLPFSAYAITEREPAKRIAAELEQEDWEEQHRGNASENSGIVIPERVLIVVQAGEEPHAPTPIGWPTARRLLLANGVASPSYLALQLSDPQLNKVIAQYFGVGGDLTSVGGVSIQRRVIPLACSVLLLGAACILMGTWACYRAAPTSGEEIKAAWVMLNTDSGLIGVVCLQRQCYSP
jgi:hypothetical protein